MDYYNQALLPVLQVALDCYNQALLAAPADPWDGQGEEMALALANRYTTVAGWVRFHAKSLLFDLDETTRILYIFCFYIRKLQRHGAISRLVLDYTMFVWQLF